MSTGRHGATRCSYPGIAPSAPRQQRNPFQILRSLVRAHADAGRMCCSPTNKHMLTSLLVTSVLIVAGQTTHIGVLSPVSVPTKRRRSTKHIGILYPTCSPSTSRLSYTMRRGCWIVSPKNVFHSGLPPRAHLLEYQHHRASDDAEAATNALWSFFTLPVRTLQSARTGRWRRRQTIRTINRRLSSVIAAFDGEEGFARRSNVRIRAEVTGRCRSTIALDGCPAIDNSQSSDDPTTFASIRRDVHLASNGYFGRASRALKHTSAPAPAHAPQVHRQLTQLHPQAAEEMPTLPDNIGQRFLSDHDMNFFSRHVTEIGRWGRGRSFSVERPHARGTRA